MRVARPSPLGSHFGPEREMGEKVSEAPEPVPRSCSSHGVRTPVLAVAAASSPGASSAESSSGSETLSEEGEPRGFSRLQPPPPPGGALGTRPLAAWAPARVVLELGVRAQPPPLGEAAPPASQEEQDEEVGAAFPHLGPFGPGCGANPAFYLAHGRGAGSAGAWRVGGSPSALSRAGGMTFRSLPVGHPPWLLPLCVCVYMRYLTVCFENVKAANSLPAVFATVGL